MKKLGAYIGESYSSLKKNTFVWYEVVRKLNARIGVDTYEVSFWNLKDGYPNGRKPNEKFKTTNKYLIESTIIPIKEIPNKYCIEWENQQLQIKECEVHYDYYNDYEFITTLKLDQFGSNNYCHWEWKGERTFSVLKDATVNRIYRLKEPTFNNLTMPDELTGDQYKIWSCSIDNTIKDELKKSLEQDAMKSALNSIHGMGGFTTTNDFVSNRVLEVNEALKIWKNKNKETKTMEKKMTITDSFLKNLKDITITSTYSKLDRGFGDPYYIYYPEMEITESIADTLLTVLLMAKREYIHKVVFNPEKGTTTISKSTGDPVTVRCKDGEFDYILGYEMARSKMYLGGDDYNWFNKIKNHRKTHIEYTEKKPTKKGGKK